MSDSNVPAYAEEDIDIFDPDSDIKDGLLQVEVPPIPPLPVPGDSLQEWTNSATGLTRAHFLHERHTPRCTILPTNYVLPYVQPRPLVERVGSQPTHPPAQRRAIYHQNSSDEFPPRNATPGPSNVPRTPSSAYPIEEAEDYGRYLRAWYRTPSPNPLLVHIPIPQRAHFENAQTQIQALVLEQALPHPGNTSPIWVGTPNNEPPAPLILHTAATIRVSTPANLNPYPQEDSNSDSSNYRGNEPVPEREDDDPLNAYGGDYEPGSSDGSTSSSDPHFTPQMSESQWDSTLPSPTQPHFHDTEETLPWRPEYSPTEIDQNVQPLWGIEYRMLAPEPRLNSASWSTTYSHWPSQRETAPTWTELPDFDNFNQDKETFGGYTTNVYGEYQGYTPAPQQPFYTAPFPLPDSPNWEYRQPATFPTHLHHIQGYRPPQYGTHPFAGQDPPDPVNNQAGGLNDPLQPTREERLERARLQSQENRSEYDILKAQLEAAQDKMTRHDQTWDFNQPPDDDKGKKPECGHPLIPNYRRPLYKREDRFSVPHPSRGKGRPHPMPQPIGHAPPDAAYLGIKPILMQPPKPFKGTHDDIEHFIGDCITYFEAFTTYFWLDSQMVPFAASYFEGPAKEWWVYKRPEFWANDDDDPVSARFRYPTWLEFISILTAQFRDPTVEIVHKRKMFEVRMGKNPASQFFYELEKEAKLAGRRNDETKRGTLVAAIRRGLPKPYTTMIANIGRDIPQTYPDWKARILVMYDKRQKNYAFDQHLNHRDNRQLYKGTATTTATSNNKAGGVTSSSSGKPMSSVAPSGGRDSQGRWLSRLGTTFRGAGVPMDIGQMRAQGLCFRCHKKGHLSKDCLEKKDFRDIQSVQVTNELVTESKIKEVKEEGKAVAV
ncbi:uncharacterized protein ARMOST_10087 [Armillaria ostoyae]|uniref:CCHC-type domain-containing protein n=1 Tax=Armillaria ostoyae TaxID=47428 RepID=A0A284RDG1_ARMOS|nr:uncharacterized protein ARMOST_10087 [Armillaria ostoyae]